MWRPRRRCGNLQRCHRMQTAPSVAGAGISASPLAPNAPDVLESGVAGKLRGATPVGRWLRVFQKSYRRAAPSPVRGSSPAVGRATARTRLSAIPCDRKLAYCITPCGPFTKLANQPKYTLLALAISCELELPHHGVRRTVPGARRRPRIELSRRRCAVKIARR